MGNPLPPTPLPPVGPEGSHILSVLTIKNLTSRRLPIGGGIILQGGQTRARNCNWVQIQEEMIPRLQKLAQRGYVSYTLSAGQPQDVAGSPAVINLFVSAPTEAETNYLGQIVTTLAGNTQETTDAAAAAWVMTRPGTLANLFVNMTTAPSAGQSVTYTVYKNGVATALTVTVTGTATTGSNTVSTVSYSPGDLITVQQIMTATSAAAGVSIAFQTAS